MWVMRLSCLSQGAGFVSVRGYGMHDATHKERVAYGNNGVFFQPL